MKCVEWGGAGGGTGDHEPVTASMSLSPPVPWFFKPEAANAGQWAKPRHTLLVYVLSSVPRQWEWATVGELSDRGSKDWPAKPVWSSAEDVCPPLL